MNDLIDRQSMIDKFEPWLKVEGYSEGERNMLKGVLYELTVMPPAQPEEAIPVSWIEAIIKKFMMSDDAFSGLTASIIRVMLNEWKKEQEGDTT